MKASPSTSATSPNLQDGVVIHALETVAYGKPVWKNTYAVYGQRYAVYIGDRVSLAHQSHVHGSAYIEDDVFVGMQSMVFMSHIGRGSVIEPGAKVMGVSIPPGRYVKIGSIVADQKTADNLPENHRILPVPQHQQGGGPREHESRRRLLRTRLEDGPRREAGPLRQEKPLGHQSGKRREARCG